MAKWLGGVDWLACARIKGGIVVYSKIVQLVVVQYPLRLDAGAE